MFCYKCGKEVDDAALFCQFCGESFKKNVTIDPLATTITPTSSSSLNCANHPGNTPSGFCIGCGKAFCSECIKEIKGKNYCFKCIEEKITDQEKKIDHLMDRKSQSPMVFMNAGGGISAAINSSGNLPLRRANKNKSVAAVLSFFLGGFGGHHFYLGNTGRAILYLIFCWTYIPAFIALIEFILLLVMKEEEFDHKYNF